MLTARVPRTYRSEKPGAMSTEFAGRHNAREANMTALII